MKNFYCPMIEPSFTNSGDGILFEFGNMPSIGKPVSWVWNAVCNSSEELGHYYDSKNVKYKL